MLIAGRIAVTCAVVFSIVRAVKRLVLLLQRTLTGNAILQVTENHTFKNGKNIFNLSATCYTAMHNLSCRALV